MCGAAAVAVVAAVADANTAADGGRHANNFGLTKPDEARNRLLLRCYYDGCIFDHSSRRKSCFRQQNEVNKQTKN